MDLQAQAREELMAKSALAWVLAHNFKNENDQPIEFVRHRFLAEPYNDDSPDLVVMKSAQIGWSTLAILKMFHALKYRGMNAIYTLPTQNVVDDFVVPKVDRFIEINPELKAIVTQDSRKLKRVGDRFAYFKGSFVEREAIMVAADLLVNDELDRSDQSILTIYQSRLQASLNPIQWRFSNPSVPAFGVHELYQNSDQRHWFITCSHCKHEVYITYEKDDYIKNHYVDQERVIYACGKCHKEITMEARQGGRWVAKNPKVERRGYWISQLMVPWVPAKKIIEQSKEGIDFFYNFVLGLPYQASELLLNREAILRCVDTISTVDKTDLFMGVDVGKEKHWVLGNAQGIFAYGVSTDWDEIERLFTSFGATTVIDALPDFTIPEQYAKRYPGKVFVHYYVHDSKKIDVSAKDESKNFGVIQSDRVKLLDQLAGEIATQSIKFFIEPDKLNDLIYHAENIYRMVEEDTRGIQKARWEHKENKPDHWIHALAYWRTAVSISPLSGTTGSTMLKRPMKTQGIHVEDGGIPVSSIVDLKESRKRAARRKWKRP